MIKNSKQLRDFEREYEKKQNRDLDEKYKILDAMYREAKYLGVFPLKNPLEGIEVDIKIAKVVNSV
ncbi:hypothetical protein KAW18_00795 [candidate division WOR-3 bacterium]|nr:hypothetical protein [candidate division WOR-3 bacterium]MCK4525877.1 hypothetical protein [candidate division WOR-3 bacterium]